MRRSLAITIVAALVLVSAGPAHSRWTEPRVVARGELSTLSASSIAVTPRGLTAVTWGDTSGRMFLRWISPTGRRSPVIVTAVDRAGPTGGAVALDRRGNAVIAWPEFVDNHWQVFARRVARDGTLGTLHQISDPAQVAWRPAVVVTQRGRALVTYDQGATRPGHRYGRMITRTDRLLSPQSLGKGDPETVDACGDESFVAAGSVRGGSVKLFRLTTRGERRTRMATDDERLNALPAGVTCDAEGTAHLAYILRDRSSVPYQFTGRGRAWQRSGRLTSAVRLTPRAIDPHRLVIDADATGDMVVAWATNVDSREYDLHLRTWAGSRVGAVKAAGRATGTGDWPMDLPPQLRLSVGAGGTGLLQWLRADETHLRTWVRPVSTRGVVGRTHSPCRDCEVFIDTPRSLPSRLMWRVSDAADRIVMTTGP